MDARKKDQVEESFLIKSGQKMLRWLLNRDNHKKIINNNSKQQDESIQDKEIREGREVLSKLMDEFKSQTSLNVDANNLTNAINNFQFYETLQFRINGYNDGVKGTEDRHIESSAKVRASFIFEHTNSILTGKYNGLTNEIDFNINKIDEIDSAVNKEMRFNKEINFLNKKEHRNFSRPLAIFYIIVGIVIMFADFPISLGIAKYFIDLPITFQDTFFDKITNPEIVLFSAGITFLSVYFKILYDEYINISIISKNPEDEHDQPIHKTTFNAPSIFRLLFKLSVLILLIYLLYNIGNVRNAFNDLSIKSTYKAFVSEKDIFNYKLVSFIGTTILLPLLSGICLSLGFSTLSNVSNLRSSNKKLENFSSVKTNIEKEKTVSETILHMLESLKDEWTGNTQKLDDLKQLFINSYKQGFKSGRRAKFGYDLYGNANSLYIDAINSI